MQSVVSDELLRDLMAVGQVDVLVGLPTQNHAETAPAVARAVAHAFAGPFVRERTVLLNLDANSSDHTPEAIRGAAAAGDVLSTRYALRTTHRLTIPYHGVPDRPRALRLLFTVAELLHARAVVVLDPTASSITADDVARWIHSVLLGGADYVKPALPRSWHEGPLISQFVRPLLRVAYGVELLEPLDTQLACSPRFFTDAALAQIWELASAQIGVDAFLTAQALLGKYELMQIVTSAHARPLAERRPKTADVLLQVLESVLACLAWSFPRWPETPAGRSIDPARSPEPPEASMPRYDLRAFDGAFRAGVDALSPLLLPVIGERCLSQLQGAALMPEPAVEPQLWAETLLGFVAFGVGRKLPLADLARMLEPLYLGRVASFVRRGTARDAQAEVEALAGALERQRPAFLTGLEHREDP